MSFGLTPKEYLAMVVEAYEDFKANPLSIRHLLSVCTLANHLPEIVASNTPRPIRRRSITASTGRHIVIKLQIYVPMLESYT